mgnify:CR=1 FL=1
MSRYFASFLSEKTPKNSLKEDNKVDVTVQKNSFERDSILSQRLKEDNKVDVTVQFYSFYYQFIIFFPSLKEDNKVDVTVQFLSYSHDILFSRFEGG